MRPRPFAFVLGMSAGLAAVAAAPHPGVGAAPSATPPAAVPPAAVPPAAATDDDRVVDALLARMSLRDKAAQMVMPWLPGGVEPGSRSFQRAQRLVATHRVGGLIVGKGDRGATTRALRTLQRRSRVPLLMATDLEWGAGMRLIGATLLPTAMAVAATGDTSLAYAHGRAAAAEARAAGLHVALAPVLDVNVNPRNPIINTRSFGEDPEAVARFGSAVVRGLQDGGLIAVGKHFPGHGDTDQDSHLALPTISATRARLDTVELVPFRAAIDAGVRGVLVAHIAVPAVSGARVPASLSPAVATTLLRRDLGFGGLVLTDALNMAGVTRHAEASEIALRAVLAGADILLQPTNPELAIDAITEAVARGQVSRERIDASVRRILRAKARVGLLADAPSRSAPPLTAAQATAVARPLADSIAARSITLLRDWAGVLSARPSGRIVSLVYAGTGVVGGPNAAFDSTLRAHGAQVERRTLFAGAARALVDSLLGAWSIAPPALVVLSSYTEPVPWRESIGLPSGIAAAVDEIAQRVPVAHIAFGSPYVIESVPSASTVLLAWTGIPASQRAAARALLGVAGASGRLPVALRLPPRAASER